MTLISLLILVIVLGLVFWLVNMLIATLPLAPAFKTAALCIVILIAIIVLLDYSGILGGGSVGCLRIRC